MKGVLLMERLSITDIESKYPSQWVGLANVEWDSQNDASVVSAEVVYVGKTQSELLDIQHSSKMKIVPYFTTPNAVLQLGAVM